MHPEIKNQKLQLQLALNWIDMAEQCEAAIASGHPEKEWWVQRRKECASSYAECIEALLRRFIPVEELMLTA